MKKIIFMLMFLIVVAVETTAAGYFVFSNENPGEFMDGVRGNRKKYNKVLLDEKDDEFETYVYRLGFQIIAQVGGREHVATVTGPASSPEKIEEKIEEAKEEILSREVREYAREKKVEDREVI